MVFSTILRTLKFKNYNSYFAIIVPLLHLLLLCMQSKLFQLEISKVFFIVQYNRYIVIIQAQRRCAFMH